MGEDAIRRFNQPREMDRVGSKGKIGETRMVLGSTCNRLIFFLTLFYFLYFLSFNTLIATVENFIKYQFCFHKTFVFKK